MKNVREFAYDWLPPILLNWILQFRGGGRIFEGEYATWDKASARCSGYDGDDILYKVLASTLKVKAGEAAYERDSVLFTEPEYAWSVLSGLMWVAALNRGRLNVLDFGGALGSSYFQNRSFLNTLPNIRWNVVEQQHYVEAGQAHIQDNNLRFYGTINECLADNQLNVVLLSSVLQYLSDPECLLFSLLDIGADAIIIDRTIVNHSAADRIYIQRVPTSIYSASYPCRSLSEPKLLDALDSKYQLLGDFPSLNFPALVHINSEFKGYIFGMVQ